MIRRNARLRKEYLYRKGLEGKERTAYEHKRKVRQALEGTIYLSSTKASILAATVQSCFATVANRVDI